VQTPPLAGFTPTEQQGIEASFPVAAAATWNSSRQAWHRPHYITLNPCEIHNTRGSPSPRGLAQGRPFKGMELNA
jgi:hypothetical protein